MRGQVTGFAIIGVLLLIVVAGILWLTRAPTTSGPTVTGPSLTVEACIENAAIDAIRAVGLAGGIDPDSGTLRRTVTVSGLGTNHVRRGILSYTPGSYSYGPDANHYLDHDGRTGVVTFKRFDVEPNSQSTSDILTRLIRNTGNECSDRIDGTVEIGTITYSETSTIIRAVVRESGRSPQDVTVSLPIPVREYHRIVRQLLIAEANDARFRIATFAPTGDYTVRTMPNTNAAGDSLLILESNRPLLGAEPFRYLVVIDNRPPVFLTDPGAFIACADVYNALDDGDLIDPDDGHTPTIDSCDDDSGSLEITIRSGSRTYEVTV